MIVVEDHLKITNMVRSAKGTAERPGTNVAAKSGLNRSIADAGGEPSCRSSRTTRKKLAEE